MNYLVLGVLFVIHLVDSQNRNCIGPISGSNGKCVHIRQCEYLNSKFMRGLVNNTINPQTSSYLMKFAEPFCCADLPLNICGDTRRYNIAGGKSTDINQYNFMAVIQYENIIRNEILDLCSGTIIAQRYVLTAAHCINRKNDKLHSVVLGEHTKKVDPDCNGICALSVQIIRIESSKIHQQYNKTTKENDIALLRLERSADFSKVNVNPIFLASKSIEIDEQLIATGWGKTEKNKPSASLLQIDIDLIGQGECNQAFAGSGIIITDKHFCAGSQKGVKACVGDSGGPSFEVGQLDEADEPKYIQQGIVSFSKNGCANNIAPNVFTRISSFYDWILDNLEP